MIKPNAAKYLAGGSVNIGVTDKNIDTARKKAVFINCKIDQYNQMLFHMKKSEKIITQSQIRHNQRNLIRSREVWLSFS